MERCRIFLVRHGQSEYNRKGLVNGHSDPELTELGVKQAHTTKAKLEHVNFDQVYSSDLQRAAKTAGIIYGEPVHPDRQLTGLRERDFGSIEGKHSSHYYELRDRPRRQAMDHETRWKDRMADDMESDHEVATRVEKNLIELAKQHIGETILVGAHGGVMRTLLIHLSYCGPEQLPSGSVDNAAYVELIYDDAALTVADTHGINLRG